MPKEVTNLLEGCPFLQQTGCAGMTETMRPRSSAPYPGSLHAAARQVPHHRAAFRRISCPRAMNVENEQSTFLAPRVLAHRLDGVIELFGGCGLHDKGMLAFHIAKNAVPVLPRCFLHFVFRLARRLRRDVD
jgi:hypothetical protein